MQTKDRMNRALDIMTSVFEVNGEQISVEVSRANQESLEELIRNSQADTLEPQNTVGGISEGNEAFGKE